MTTENITRTDERLPNGCTLRRWSRDGEPFRWDVYNPSGFRHGGNYKTEAGARRGADHAAAKHAVAYHHCGAVMRPTTADDCEGSDVSPQSHPWFCPRCLTLNV